MDSRKMCWFVRSVLPLSLIALAACTEHEPCGEAEICNLADDDCDRQIDEDFRDENGDYYTLEHCGACGVDCRAVHPHATEVECAPMAGSYGCVALACEPGYHLSGNGCLPDADVLCLPCEDDSDCETFWPGARCADLRGSLRCVRPCTLDPCPTGYECLDGECHPASGSCSCTPENEGMAYGCLLGTETATCAGQQICQDGELTECEPAFEEICNGEDDDCDGDVDEDFLDALDRYVHPEHCGECNRPCAPRGPNVEARCEVVDWEPTCVQECMEGFVDLDGIDANGCECERTVGTWPPSRLGVDADCDGEIDDTDEFIFVASWGSDSDPGTLVRPMRTINAGMERAALVSKTVLVTGGIFHERVAIVGGVEVYGGYNADFSDRDPILYTTVVQPHDGRHGHPALTCRGVTEPAVLGGMTIQGSDATVAGAGSTAAYLDGCSSAVELVDLIVVAGRGADGRAGADSSDNLSGWGLTSLLELNGEDGEDGRDGYEASSPTCLTASVAGGEGGQSSCPGTGNALHGGDGGDSSCVDAGCRVGAPCGNSGCTDFMVGDVCDREAMMAAAVPNHPGEDGAGPGAGAGGPPTYDAPTNRGTCHFCDDNPTLARVGEPGGTGEPGSDGEGGQGCDGLRRDFDPSTGLVTSGDGDDGEPGTDGGGGGGGSSGSGYDVVEGIFGCNDALGGSGGGGGGGGCGAPRASGGGGGGASVGIVLRLPAGATEGPRCRNVTVVASTGGSGGPGGIGAAGGSAGDGGLGGGTSFWCSRRGGRGGDGGDGGDGGGGGGGCGGDVSGFYVIAGESARPYLEALEAENSVEALPAGGRGGPGGFSPGSSGTAGADGTAEAFRQVE